MAISTRPYDHKHVSLFNKHVWRFFERPFEKFFLARVIFLWNRGIIAKKNVSLQSLNAVCDVEEQGNL